MPGRIFSQLRIPAPHQLDKNFPGKNSSIVSLDEARRSSMDHGKRPNSLVQLAKRHGGSSERNKSKSKSQPGSRNVSRERTSPMSSPIQLGLVIESPPVLFIGTPQQSTGALMSGQVQLNPSQHEEVILEDLTLSLECTTTVRRPVHERCRECATRTVDLYEWHFLSRPRVVNTLDGVQNLPFSYLIPGHLPATTRGSLASIDYSLHVRARSSNGQRMEFRRDLIINRALIPGQEKNSVRIFPPTELQLHVTLPNIVHPIGEFPVQCRMTGITSRCGDDSQTRWRLRKLTWRIEEHEAAVSPPCPNHVAKAGGEGKGISHEFTREIGTEELKAGWKTDFDQGRIEGEFFAAIDPRKQPQCGIDGGSPSAFKVSHHLVLELVIAEEWVPLRKPNAQPTPTGAARVLRTQFLLHVSHRAGLGISWDDEMPPVYEDVPASPPRYHGATAPHTTIEDYDADDLHEDVEHLSLT